MNNQLNIYGDTFIEITQYLNFNDLINIGLTNKNNYDKIFIDPLIIISIYNLSLINNKETLFFFEKINKKIFVKNLIIINKNNCSESYIEMEKNFLKILNLNNCWTINKLLFLSKLINLKELNLSRCNNITNDELLTLSKLSNLVKLDLSYCNKITDIGINYLSKLSNLVKLDLL